MFFASIMVPLLKLIAMTLLLRHGAACVRAGSRMQRTRLYRLVEFVGRWSMLDIYVVAILVALVQLQALATITARARALSHSARWWC